MTHGRTAKTRANTRKKKYDRRLTPVSGNPNSSLEGRVTSLEARMAKLEEAVDSASGVVPAHLYGKRKTKPGPPEKIDDTELFLNRDNIVHWLEEHWPEIASPLRSAPGPRDIAAVLRRVAVTPNIRPEWQKRFVGHPAKLGDFLRSKKFRIKPPKKTVVDALCSLDDEQRKRAANRLPTRQIANAMAGVPKLKWRTSLDKCSPRPSSYRVGHNTAMHYRALFSIPEAGNGNTATYTCDGNGLRVEKVVTGTNAVTTIVVRSGGQVIAEYDNGAAVTAPTREYLYGNNLLAIVTGSSGGAGGTILYQHRDHLSPRLYTDVNGNDVGEQGTYPFGESWYNNNTTSNWVYTSYERDQESGNDYALARSYANSQGRFLAPDPLEGIVGDPQSWNRYAYVENDPINLSDPSGQGFWEDLGFAIADIFAAYFAPAALPALGYAEAADETAQEWVTILINYGPRGGTCTEGICWGGDPGPGHGPGEGPSATDPASVGSNPEGSASQGGGGSGAGTAQDTGASGQGPTGGGAGTGSNGPVYQEPNAANPTEVLLTDIVYNETSILRATRSGAGGAANLHNARLAIAEIALRRGMRGVAPPDLPTPDVVAINAGNADAINAHNDSLAAARAAISGSNTTNGATQYRTRLGTNVTTPVGNRPGHPGTPVSMHFGPFRSAWGRTVVVVAP
jgi:RHS repeat-associated protein